MSAGFKYLDMGAIARCLITLLKPRNNTCSFLSVSCGGAQSTMHGVIQHIKNEYLCSTNVETQQGLTVNKDDSRGGLT